MVRLTAKIAVEEIVKQYKLKGYKYIRSRWIYKRLFPLFNRKEIVDALKELEKEGVVKREKRGVYLLP